MAKKIIYSAVAVIGIAAASGAAWWHLSKPTMPREIAGAAPGGPASGARAPAAASSAPRVAGVEVAKAERATLQDDAVSVGSLRSRQNVVVRPEVPGRVMRLGFSDGGPVRRGQLLVQLDDTLQRAEIKQAQAQVSIAQANFKRNQELVAEKFVAQRVLDESAANLQVAEAQLSLACARWSRMAILAPFDGTVGIRNVNLGDFVKDGADLVNLEDLSSMYVDFRLPERYQGKLRLKQTVELQLDSIPGRVFKATVEAIDPLLDVNGRSVGVRAVLPNTMGEPLRAPGGRPGGPGGPGGRGGPGGPPGGAGDKAGPGGKPLAGGPPGAGGSREARPAGAGRVPGANRAAPGASPVTSGSDVAAAAPARTATDIAGCPTAAERMAVAVEAPRAPAPSAGPSSGSPTGGARRPGAAGAGAGAGAGPGPGPGAGSGGRGGGGGGGAPDGADAAPLRPGMFARVTTVFAIKQAAIVVPEEAIVPQGGRQFVIKVVEPGAVPAASASAPPPEVKFVSLRQEVKLGARQLGKVEITDGLVEGETVVVAGQQRLQRDGTPLRVVDLSRPGQGAAGAARGAASAPAAAASQ